MSQLAAVHLPDRLVELAQQVQSSTGDFPHDRATILRIAMALDELSFFQTIEKPSYIRIASNHALGNFAA